MPCVSGKLIPLSCSLQIGIAGEYSAVPFGAIIFTTSLLSVFAYIAIPKETKSHVFPRKTS